MATSCFNLLTKDLPSSWSELQQLVYIDRGLTAELQHHLARSIKLLTATNTYSIGSKSIKPEPGVLPAEQIRVYLASCAQLRLLYVSLHPELLGALSQIELDVTGQPARSLLECLLVYELLMQDSLGIPNTKLLDLSKVVSYYCLNIRPALWTHLESLYLP